MNRAEIAPHKIRSLKISKQTIVDIISALLVLLFVYAATNKLMDYGKFKVQIGQSPLLVDYANQIAWLIPAIEIIISILLMFRKTTLNGLFLSFGLMVIFTTYIVVILNFSDHIPCSCGGILEKMGWTEHLVFNIGFVALTTIAIFLQIKIEASRTK